MLVRRTIRSFNVRMLRMFVQNKRLINDHMCQAGTTKINITSVHINCWPIINVFIYSRPFYNPTVFLSTRPYNIKDNYRISDVISR